MAGKATSDRVYILHARAFQESSLLLDAFTQQQGIISLLAKGAKRPRSRLKGILQAFIPLELSWVGRAEIKTLVQADVDIASAATLSGATIWLGLYLNELLLKLLARQDPHPGLFLDYQQILQRLANAATSLEQEWQLRCFEVKLLRALGYALDLRAEAECLYIYDPEWGIVQAPAQLTSGQVAVSGACILALAQETMLNPTVCQEAKKLLRTILALHLGGKTIRSREIFTMKNILT